MSYVTCSAAMLCNTQKHPSMCFDWITVNINYSEPTSLSRPTVLEVLHSRLDVYNTSTRFRRGSRGGVRGVRTPPLVIKVLHFYCKTALSQRQSLRRCPLRMPFEKTLKPPPSRNPGSAPEILILQFLALNILTRPSPRDSDCRLSE